MSPFEKDSCDFMAQVDGDPPLSGHVEVDETYIGGRRAGGKRSRSAQQGGDVRHVGAGRRCDDARGCERAN